LKTVFHVGSITCESALNDADARFVLAETFKNSGTAPVEILVGALDHPKNASHLDAAVILGKTETVISWRLPFGPDVPHLAKLWKTRTPAAGTSIAPGDSVQIALPIALKSYKDPASAGPIDIAYRSQGKTYKAIGITTLQLSPNKC
jgi:hypothetical protein